MSGKNIFILLLCCCSILAASCKKNNDNYGNPATVQLLNAMDDGMQLLVNYSGTHPIRYNRSLELWNKYYSRENSITIHQLPQSLALYSKEDTLPKDLPVLNPDLDLVQGGAYSFIAYGSKANPEFLLNKDDHTTGDIRDSLTFIRVINLWKGQKISVNLKDKPVGSVAQDVDYKQVTAFKGFDVKMSVVEHVFEFRDQASGTLLLSYTVAGFYDPFTTKNTWLNRTNTLVLTGHINGAGINEPLVVHMPHFL